MSSGMAILSATFRNVYPGTYTPTLTVVANITGTPTAYVCQYTRNGSVVTVSGKLDLDITNVGASTQIGISLPIASDFASAEQCAGSISSPSAQQHGSVLGDTTNNRAQAQFLSINNSTVGLYFEFTYSIV